MFAELVKSLDQRWSVISLQMLILLAGAYFYNEGVTNLFILGSAAMIFTLFNLQVISRRFLLIYPMQGFLKRKTTSWDTHVLHVLLMLSTWLLFLGILEKKLNWLANTCLSSTVSILFFVILIGLPAYWLIDGRKRVQQKVVDELKKEPLKYKSFEECPICGEKELIEIEKKVISEQLGQIDIRCSDDKEISYNELIQVAY